MLGNGDLSTAASDAALFFTDLPQRPTRFFPGKRPLSAFSASRTFRGIASRIKTAIL
jgi:hypothetical protein